MQIYALLCSAFSSFSYLCIIIIMRAATLRNYNTSDQGPYDRNFLVRINNENFLRGATERNTR